MKKIIVDEALVNRLEGLAEDFELCDAKGNVLVVAKRTFTPEEWEELEDSTTAEELEQIANSSDRRYSTSEMLDYLRSL